MKVRCPSCEAVTPAAHWTLFGFVVRFAELEPSRSYWKMLPDPDASLVVTRARCPACGEVVCLPKNLTVCTEDDPDQVRWGALAAFQVHRQVQTA